MALIARVLHGHVMLDLRVVGALNRISPRIVLERCRNGAAKGHSQAAAFRAAPFRLFARGPHVLLFSGFMPLACLTMHCARPPAFIRHYNRKPIFPRLSSNRRKAASSLKCASAHARACCPSCTRSGAEQINLQRLAASA